VYSELFSLFSSSFVASPSVLWYCWLGLLACKNRLPYNLYCVGGDLKHSLTHSLTHSLSSYTFGLIMLKLAKKVTCHVLIQYEVYNVRNDCGTNPVEYTVFEHSSTDGRKLLAVQLTLKKPGELTTKNCPSTNPDPLVTCHSYCAVGYASLAHSSELFTVKFSCIPLTHTYRGQSAANKRYEFEFHFFLFSSSWNQLALTTWLRPPL